VDCRPRHSVLVRDGHWWQHDPSNPATSFYFSTPEGRTLFTSLVGSGGSEARISSWAIDSGWLLNSWCGLVALCGNRTVAEEVSSGCGERLAVGPRIHRISDGFIALQRNQANYAHFLVEVATSLVAFESRVAAFPRLTIGSRFGREILQRAGFRQEITIAPPQSLLRVRQVEVLRMLPSGFLQPALLHELALRVRASLPPGSPGAEVVLLIRSPRDTRQLVNWREVAACLTAHFPALDVVIPGELPLEEQIRRLAAARIVVAAQGAHAANILWAERLEHYIEITANGDGYVAAVARALGARVHTCFGVPVRASPEHLPYRELQFADFRVDPQRLESVLRCL
jgi:capsular polysaccharide biosynthesis protein